MKCSLHLGASPLLILAQTHKCIHVYTQTHGPRKNSKKHNNGGEKKCCWTSWTEAGTASQLIQPIRFGPDSCRTASRTKTTPRPLLRWRQITQRHRQTGGGRERKTERYREEYRRVKAVTRVEFSRLKKTNMFSCWHIWSEESKCSVDTANKPCVFSPQCSLIEWLSGPFLQY